MLDFIGYTDFTLPYTYTGPFTTFHLRESPIRGWGLEVVCTGSAEFQTDGLHVVL